ncbi:hypothetical protein R3W88_015291 [Solanum pinnatisectum]|uniref:Nop domain-containing protein n=1 Tax=Solanum pinnatisectum TaxID=50273 RepID=A0AAV9KVD5_9SOLN|nr:hypothetical protein R3W88_015291 [Solanum pinnatisectum]
MEACDKLLALDSAKKKVLQFIENRMGYLAPNLPAVVGSVVAVKLICAAGDLSSLAKIGYINQTGIFKTTPHSFKIQTYQLLAEKLKLDWQKPRPVPVPTESEPCMRKRDGRVMIFGIPEKPSPSYGMLTSSSPFVSEQRIKLSNSAKAAC